ncbi:MAG: hypothetical protein WBH98_03650 [Bacteroidales bacterium]
MITKAITDLLYHNECVVIPGFGGFVRSNIPSSINAQRSEILPPNSRLMFNDAIKNNDGLLYHYISITNKCSYSESKQLVDKWVSTNVGKLQKKQAIILDGLGYLKYGSQGNIEFVPNMLANYNINSFGLPTVKLYPVRQIPVATVSEPVVAKTVTFKPNNVALESLKWAAVLLPFVGLGIAAGINNKPINKFLNNQTGLFSWVVSTPGKTIEEKNFNIIEKDDGISKIETYQPKSPADYINFREPSPLQAENSEVDVKSTVSDEILNNSASRAGYYIIGGAFSISSNADKFCEASKQEGYSTASIVGTTPSGLILVSLSKSDTKDEATEMLKKVKSAGHEQAWIYKI